MPKIARKRSSSAGLRKNPINMNFEQKNDRTNATYCGLSWEPAGSAAAATATRGKGIPLSSSRPSPPGGAKSKSSGE